MSEPLVTDLVIRREFEAQRTVARMEAEAAEARAMSVVRREYGLVGPAGYWEDVGWWSLRLGEPDEAWPAFRRSLEWYLRWLDYLGTAGPPLRRRASDWMIVIERAILWGDREAEAAVLAIPVQTDDGSLSRGRLVWGRGWVEALRALALGEDDAAAAAAAILESVSDDFHRAHQGYPRCGPAVRAILESDSECLRVELDAICAQHVVFATRGNMRLSERALQCIPATCLAILARRRGIPADVDERYHAVRLKLPVTVIEEWQGEPVGRQIVEGTFDIVPRVLLPDVPGRPPHRPPSPVPPMSVSVAIEQPDRPRERPTVTRRRRPAVDEAIVRESLRRRELAGGSVWQLASWALMLGDPVRARMHLVRGASEAERAWRGSVGFRDDDPAVPAELRGFTNHNYLRTHFALALVVGDEGALAETARQMNEWDRALLRVHPSSPIRIGVTAYLDLIRDLLTPRADRPDGPDEATLARTASRLRGFYQHLPYTCVALVERDPERLAKGLAGILAEHAPRLRLKTAPPPPVCEEAVYLAGAGRRLGIPIRLGGRYRQYPVPILIRNLPEYVGQIGKLPCDLLGEPLWARGDTAPAGT